MEELQNSTARDEDQISSEMEVDGDGVGSPKFGNEGDIMFAREEPLGIEESVVSRVGCHGAKTYNADLVTLSNAEKMDVETKENKLGIEDSTEVNTLFKQSVVSHDWELAESMISEADPQTRNDFLCYLLDFVWFLWTKPALYRTEELIEMIVSRGACDFKRAAICSSRLASAFLVCQCVSPDETDTMEERVQMLSELASDLIDFRPLLHGNTDRESLNAEVDIELRLGVFEMFLELAGDNLTGKDFTEAFDVSFVLIYRFTSSFYPGWSYGAAGVVIPDFLGTLVARGAAADIVDQSVILASCLGSTELVEVLLEVAQSNDVDVDVEEALDAASYYENIDTMEYLIEEGNAPALGPFVRAAERGCLSVVQWFVKRGCEDTEISVALTASTSSSQVEVAAYLLSLLPQHLLFALGVNIVVEAGKSKGSLEGVDFLLRSNFMGHPTATYVLADRIATSEYQFVVPELRSFLLENWSEKAFHEGLEQGVKHFVNAMMVIRRGESPLLLRNLPVALRVAISYLSVYKESVGEGGRLLSQRSRGQLVVAVWRLENVLLVENTQSKELVDVMERHLGSFL